MLAAQQRDYVFGDFSPPDDLIDVELCRYSGKLAGDTCRRMESAYRERVPQPMIPRTVCEEHQRIERRDEAPKKGFFGTLKSWFGS